MRPFLKEFKLDAKVSSDSEFGSMSAWFGCARRLSVRTLGGGKAQEKVKGATESGSVYGIDNIVMPLVGVREMVVLHLSVERMLVRSGR